MSDNLFVRIKKIKKHIVFFNKIVEVISKKPIINNTNETISKILLDNCSISRYGDGEFKLIDGHDLVFQKNNEELVIRLKEILKSNQENHLVCIPRQINDTSWLNDRAKYFWDNYLSLNRYKIYNLIDKNKVYYDSFITRFYMDYQNKELSNEILLNLRKIWHKKRIVIVEGEKSRLGIGNDLFDNSNSIERIICPQENAYDKYEQILDNIKKVEKNKIILISLGPTATVLAYDLHKLGYIAIDIGHIDIEYEWFKKKAKEKIKIENKYVGEVINGTKVSITYDKKYNDQIISRVI